MVNKTNFETINIDDFIHDPINQEKVQSYPPELVGRFNSFIVTAFDDSMTVEMQIRTMIKWVKENIDVTMSALDNMEAFKQDSMAFQNHVKDTLVDLINQFTDKFDDNLQFEMQEILKQWDEEGYLQSLINEYTNERIDAVENDKISKGQVTMEDLTEELKETLAENPEVRDARKGYLNLKERLDNLTNVINVDDYAIGDGITDDTEAIQSAFVKASTENKNILFGNKTYVYNPTNTIEFSNGIDFGKSIIKRTDKMSENIPMVKLVHSKPKVEIDVTTVLTKINRKTLKIPELAGYGHAYVKVIDSSTKIWKRRLPHSTEPGVDKFDQFTIDNEGYVLDPITYDFDTISDLIVQPMDPQYTIIEGGSFFNDSKGTISNYYRNGLVIEKSNVILRNIYHTLDTDENASPTDGFIYISNCANVLLENVRLEPRTMPLTNGTYDFSVSKVVNLTLRNIHAPHYTEDKWGVMGGNFIKNLLVENCNMNRIDAHMGVHNLTVRDSTLGRKGISVSGYGDMILDNLKVYSKYVIDLRKDYGASWDGNIVARNITHYRTRDEYIGFINAEFYTDFDYGDTGRPYGMGTTVTVNNYIVDNQKLTLTESNHMVPLIKILPEIVEGKELKNDYYLPNNIEFRNCRSINKLTGKEGFVFMRDPNISYVRSRKQIKDSDPYKFDTNVNVILDSIEFAELYYSTWQSSIFLNSGGTTIGQRGDDTYGQVLNRAYWGITILNSDKVHVIFQGKYVKLHAQNCEFSRLTGEYYGSRSWFKLDSCTIKPRIANDTDVAISAKFDRYQFNNCTFDRVFVGDDETIQDNPFEGAYKNVLALPISRGNITPYVQMSGCRLNHIDIKTIKTDIVNYDFHFGNCAPYQISYPIIGATEYRPAYSLKAGIRFYDQTINKLIIYDGSNWRQADGTLAN